MIRAQHHKAADLRVVVVGGSLAGLAFALACAVRGIHTQVLERVQGLRRNGAALGIDRALLLRVINGGTNAASETDFFPVLTSYRNATSWKALHHWLRNKALERSEIVLQEDTAVSEVTQSAKFATAITTTGQRIDATMIVGADGYRSVVRRAINPDQPHALYAGYLLWRGLVCEADLPSNIPLMENNDGVALTTASGHRLIAYPVAAPSGSLHPGERQISFAWYDKTRIHLLRQLGCLSVSNEVLSSLKFEDIPRTVLGELRILAIKIWPDPWRAAIEYAVECGNLFATPAAEYFPERLRQGRLAVIGDAAHIVAPVTGRGFIEGLLDAEVLAACLAQASERVPADIPQALASFEHRRLPNVQALVSTSMESSRAYVRGGKFPEWHGWKKKVKFLT